MTTDLTIKITAVLNGILVEVQGSPDASDPFGEMSGRWVADDMQEVWDSLPEWAKSLEVHRGESLRQYGNRNA